MDVTFKKWKCRANGKYYANGRKAIFLDDIEDGSPVAVATVNIPEKHLEDNQVCIKDYSNNIGMALALIQAGIIKDNILNMVPCGYVEVSVYELTEKALKELWPSE